MTQSCKVCAKEFHVKPSDVANGGGKYCSYRCSGVGRSGPRGPATHSCEVCGTGFRPRGKRKLTAQFCSNKCRGVKLAEQMAGEGHWNWKGGRKFARGYVRVCVPDHPFLDAMKAPGQGNSILEHRLVMAESLGRPLEPHETVHHKNGVKTDNRIENLQLRTGHHGAGVAHHCADCGSTNIVASDLTVS